MLSIFRVNEFLAECYPRPAIALDSPPSDPFPRPTARGDLTTESVALALVNSHVMLMKLKFVISPYTADEGRWKVDGVIRKRKGRTEYQILFADCPEVFHMHGDELVQLMCQSCTEHHI